MKHLLNNISQEEKNSILEQHQGGMEVITKNFQKMVNKKLGDVPTFLNESKMETCEQCGNELTEGGECMECGSMYEEEMMEQDKKVVTISPEQMKMLHKKGTCDCGDVRLEYPSYNEGKKDMMEQKNIMLPDNLKINLVSSDQTPFNTFELDNEQVRANGDTVTVKGKIIDSKRQESVGLDITLSYKCKEDKYFVVYGKVDKPIDITSNITHAAKAALKNIKTYCSGSSAAL